MVKRIHLVLLLCFQLVTAAASADSDQNVNLEAFVAAAAGSDRSGGDAPAYDRNTAFGDWIVERDVDPKNCLSTRQKVLIRTSQKEVTISGSCKVKKGLWVDPYSGQTYNKATWVQIDHMVPLKNAWNSGAWKWSQAKRCHYANYLKSDYHLLPVHISENWDKKAGGPDRYLPPEPSYQCEYVKAFTKIKLLWGLDMSLEEAVAIQNVWRTRGCTAEQRMMSLQEYQEQMRLNQDVSPTCKAVGN